uniref:Uncharacterized protein n=1 Tax=Opuntia streptacantha TaxID=393608 RepID=A0A7C9DPD8_OPUST
MHSKKESLLDQVTSELDPSHRSYNTSDGSRAVELIRGAIAETRELHGSSRINPAKPEHRRLGGLVITEALNLLCSQTFNHRAALVSWVGRVRGVHGGLAGMQVILWYVAYAEPIRSCCRHHHHR